MKDVRFGLIGYKFMGKAHSQDVTSHLTGFLKETSRDVLTT